MASRRPIDMQRHTRLLKTNDHAISPVIGTILMVAATVIVAGAVYAAVNAYNGKTSKAPPDAVFKAQSLDTDGDGLEDAIKITYMSGARDSDSVRTIVKNATSGAEVAGSAITTWSPGDYQTFDPAAGASPGSFYVTVLMADQTILDQTLALKE